MRLQFLLCALLFLLLSVGSVFADTAESDLNVSIMPGVFYFSVSGELQNGVVLGGLLPYSDSLNQVGYWNATNTVDYLKFFDSTSVAGFRIRMNVSGDFRYIGADVTQSDIPASSFYTYASWDDISKVGLTPLIVEDDISKTLSIDTANSCKNSPTNPYSDYYDFNSNFYFDDFAVPFSTAPFTYLTSQNGCANQGYMNFGRFELDMGVASAGEYKSSVYIVMLDGS